MPPRLYMTEMSPPSRAALLVVKALDLQLEYININFREKEHLRPEYIKINPQHTVPTLEDGDFAVWDSHAIGIYLIEEYGNEDRLYPRDNKLRSIIHQRMFFDTELYLLLKKAVIPLWAGTSDIISSCTKIEIEEFYQTLDIFLTKTKWIACDHMTVADLSLVATVSSVHEIKPIDSERFPRVVAWLQAMEELPYYEEANGIGSRALGELIRTKLKCLK